VTTNQKHSKNQTNRWEKM